MANVLDGYGSQFFADQDVLAKDLNMIGYANTKAFRDYLKALTKTPGVLVSDLDTDSSLKVTTTDGSTFSVNSGVAIDSQGRLIRVPQSVSASGSSGADPKYRPALPARTNLSTGVTTQGIYYVNLKYTPLYADVRYDDAGDSYNTRVYDSYIISVDATRQGVTLAQIHCNSSGSILQDTTNTGYLNTNTNVYYAIYDDRATFDAHDGRIGDLDTLTSQHTTTLAEELEKSVGFIYPAPGNSFYGRLPRNATIDRLDVFCTGASGGVTVQVYSGSTANSLKLLGIANASPDTWTSHSLNLLYYKNHVIKFEVASVTGNITECTASLIYTRR